MFTLDEFLKTCNNRTIQQIADVTEIISNVKWKSVSFTIDTEPIPSHRPRLCGYRVYVPGAAKSQAYFNKKVLPKLNGLYITTPMKITADFYFRTPKSFSKTQIALAEMRILRPWGNIGDNDNLEKNLMDQMQSNTKRGFKGLISNDCLVVEIHSNKYYSMTPRTDTRIEYMDKSDIGPMLQKILRIKDEEDIFSAENITL